jgi:branched-chain amino acid transport system substrate-binding protein
MSGLWSRAAGGLRLPAVIAVTAAAITGCVAGHGPATGAPDLEPIRIAIIDPQSGDFSALGKWEHKGVKLAVDEANAAGGVGGRMIELSVFDDQGDPTTAARLTTQVGRSGYAAVFGSALSGNTLAMAPVLSNLRIPAITSGQSPALAALDNPYLFLNSTTSNTFDETLAKYAVGKARLRSIALITNDGAYGEGERVAFTAALGRRGQSPVGDQVVAVGQKDFTEELTAIQKRQPDGLFIGAEEVQSGLIAAQARAMGITARLLGAAPLGTDVFLNTAGADAAEGAFFSTPYPSNEENDATRAFATAYQTAYGDSAEFHGAKAYDGARILIQALRDSHGATGRALADAIRAVRFRGLLGTFEFDASGVGIHQTRIASIKAGVVIPVAP